MTSTVQLLLNVPFQSRTFFSTIHFRWLAISRSASPRQTSWRGRLSIPVNGVVQQFLTVIFRAQLLTTVFFKANYFLLIWLRRLVRRSDTERRWPIKATQWLYPYSLTSEPITSRTDITSQQVVDTNPIDDESTTLQAEIFETTLNLSTLKNLSWNNETNNDLIFRFVIVAIPVSLHLFKKVFNVSYLWRSCNNNYLSQCW